MLRILITADLHYDIARSRVAAEALASRAAASGGDALVLVGDTAGAQPEPLRQCLTLFGGFAGRRLLVPGNHCLWCRPGENSLDRYERLVPQWAAEAGFAVLDHQPQALGAVGLVGSIGWYDYAFRDAALGLPVAFYRAKVSPGAANYLGGHDELIEAHRAELTDRHLAMGVRWMDGVHVRLGMSDEEFVARLADRLQGQLEELAPRVDRIVAFLHHVPFAELVPPKRLDRLAFAAAYMGSPRLGEVLLACPKVTHVYCGHSHWRAAHTVGHIQVLNIGSTYTDKHLEVLEL